LWVVFKKLLGGEFSYSGGKNNGVVNDKKDLFLETVGPKLSHYEDFFSFEVTIFGQ
jgi:hypothetical protein